MRNFLLSVLAIVLLSINVAAGPEDLSKFRDTPYAPQKTVYDFNNDDPADSLRALKYVKNQLAALKEFGGYEGTHIVVVSHGNGLHTFARENRDLYPDAYKKLKQLTDQGVNFYICRNAARGRGYGTDDFYDLTTVVPAGMPEIAKWQNEGYSYASGSVGERMTRDDLVKLREETKLEAQK